MSSDALLRSELADGVFTITLHDGKANVMSLPMLRAIEAELDEALAERAVVVLAARGKAFSGGFDLATFQQRGPEPVDMLESGARLAARLLAYPRPVVAACQGHAVAMGALLLLGADIRLCADADLRIQLNEVQVGLTMPRFAIALCRQRLTPASLHRAITTAAPFDARQAQSAGFADELVPLADLLSCARQQALRLAAYPANAFAESKRRLAAPASRALDQAIAEDLADWRAAFAADTSAVAAPRTGSSAAATHTGQQTRPR